MNEEQESEEESEEEGSEEDSSEEMENIKYVLTFSYLNYCENPGPEGYDSNDSDYEVERNNYKEMCTEYKYIYLDDKWSKNDVKSFINYFTGRHNPVIFEWDVEIEYRLYRGEGLESKSDRIFAKNVRIGNIEDYIDLLEKLSNMIV